MKLILCKKCISIVSVLSEGIVSKCNCGEHACKDLSDSITAVVTKGAVVIGIDNNTFNSAIQRYNWVKEKTPEHDGRVDFYFTGWIPTKPGEVIFVDTVKDVVDYKYEFEGEASIYSTLPTRSD